jgi:pyruvate ferredoxin oxidoreductase gamma subunit
MVEIRWHGRGGQGAWTAARLLGKAAALFENKFALAFPSFGPERRGAPVLGFTKIGSQKILDRSEIEGCHYVVILDETLIHPQITQNIYPGGKVIINTAKPENYANIFRNQQIIAVKATEIALEILKRPITNTAMLAALAASTGIVRLDSLKQVVTMELNPELIAKNIQVMEFAYQTIKEIHHGQTTGN